MNNGDELYSANYNSYQFENFPVPLDVFLKLEKSISFKIILKECNDYKKRGVDRNGSKELVSESDEVKFLLSTNNIIVNLDPKTQAYLDKLNNAVKEGDERKAKEDKALITNEQRTIKVGDLLYICNSGAPCEVIAREVTSTKIKVEFISKCYPEYNGNISRWTHISQGHQRWLEKKYIYGKEKVNCYGKQSAIR